MGNTPASWAIALPRVIQRASLDLGGKTIIEYVPRLELGLHESNIAAKRAYLEGMDPDLIGCDDNFIRLHWRYCVNTGCAKIVNFAKIQTVADRPNIATTQKLQGTIMEYGIEYYLNALSNKSREDIQSIKNHVSLKLREINALLAESKQDHLAGRHSDRREYTDLCQTKASLEAQLEATKQALNKKLILASSRETPRCNL